MVPRLNLGSDFIFHPLPQSTPKAEAYSLAPTTAVSDIAYKANVIATRHFLMKNFQKLFYTFQIKSPQDEKP